MNPIFKSPYISSVLAEAYIIILVVVMSFFAKPDTPDTFFDSIAVLSIFVLSASVMGYLFLGGPVQLYLSGEKEKAVSFFAKTVVGFGVITVIAVVVLKFF